MNKTRVPIDPTRRRTLAWLAGMAELMSKSGSAPWLIPPRGAAGSAGLGALTALGGLPGLALADRHDGLPLMLAMEAPADIDPAGWLVSEKFDGVRALWDGKRLRFRSGRDVPAPDWFTRQLPPCALDGELWLGRGRFEALSGIVRKERSDEGEWRSLRFMVFDAPDGFGAASAVGASRPFSERAARIEAMLQALGLPQLVAVPQQRLANAAALQRRLTEVVSGGGEGLVLHRAGALWRPGRSSDLLKLKPLNDAEATVVGHLTGRGKYAGQLGALKVRGDDGREFLIGTGFSDADRAAPPPAGAVVTFSYRGTTAAGVPRFASFVRVREL